VVSAKQKKGPNRAQLLAENRRLKAKLAEVQRPDSLGFEGERWFELADYFDGDDIRAIPGPGRCYLLGKVDRVFVIQVPSDTDPAQLQGFLKVCQAAGISPAVAVTEEVRFARLVAVDDEMVATLEAAMQEAKSDEHDDSAGPEHERGGLGGPGAEQRGSAGDGSDHGSPAEAEGAEGPSGG
jgi:hypothetical protein